MLLVIGVILLNLWLLGITTGYTMSGFIHILVVISFMAFLVNFRFDRQLQ